MAATLFGLCVFILFVGWLWFYIARPILVDVVNTYRVDDVDNMSSAAYSEPPSRGPSLETDSETDRQTEQTPKIKAEELLTVCKLMRAHGIGREDAQAAFKASGLPFNNNVWRDAAPASKPTQEEDDDVLITPYAGRRTKASYYPDDPELEYRAP